MDLTYLAAIFALSAATAWGSGDFTSGLATRRIGPFYTILVSYTFGLIALVIVAIARGETFPTPADVMWGALAGLLGMAGLGFLLRGFAIGRMGIVAPVSAVLAAAIPVIFASLTQGVPRPLQLLGFALALVSIGLLSRPERLGSRPAGLGMALLAGLGFGGFFTLFSQISANAVFWPLAAGRIACCVVLLVAALVMRRPAIPAVLPLGLLLPAGLLDASGNLFFLLSVQSGRLDVAAVLGSLYPAVTAILARLIGREHMTRLQALGVAVAILAIVLITI